MLRIWMGPANSGKSARVLEEIRRLGDSSFQLLLVPEHASHQAEVDLCWACGSTAARHSEVLSFRLLANRVLSLTGGLTDAALDPGGKLLMMQLALQEVLPQLTVYARPSRKAPFLGELVALFDEMEAYRVAPEQLGELYPNLEGISGQKLRDLSLIYAAYQSRLYQDGKDRRDLMAKLADNLEKSGYMDGRDVFLDGFSYFTAREEQIIAVMLRRAKSVTITLLGEGNSTLEIFRQGLRTRDRLVRLAQQAGAACTVEDLTAPEADTGLTYLAQQFFGSSGTPWAGNCDQATVHRADSPFTEAEYVASEILALVRSGFCRFRDVTVAARNLGDYEAVIESVFARYGVPAYLSRRSNILDKPVMALVAGALDAVTGGYEYEDMFRWLKTGLGGLSDEECDLLENYVIQWDIHGSMWLREEPWSANPDGWREGFTPEQEAVLAEINGLRQRIREPLSELSRGLREEKSALGKLRALWGFLDVLDLAGQMEARTSLLEQRGELQLAAEYGQLWELLCGVMDQFAEILGDMPLDAEEFARLFKLVLTQYAVGTIPVSLDQVQITEITRNDRHRVKVLFLMGANDHVLPAVSFGQGLLSREDREKLLELGVELAPSGPDLFDGELQNIYAALSQPTERLVVTWPAADAQGNPLRPSFVVERLRALLPGAAETTEDGSRPFRLTAPIPALETAGSFPGGPLWAYFAAREAYGSALSAMERGAGMKRGRLSPQAVETLYGRSYRMSASRIDKVNACHFAYFMQYGLRAKERTPAGFDAAQVGTFLHYVLENVTRDVTEQGGFAQVGEEELKRLIDQAIQQYMDVAMPGFDGRDARFKYLFRRLRTTAATIVTNVARELRESDFVPMAFELGFGDGGALPAISIRAGDASLTVNGKVDRVDGWLKDGKLYLRVVDYKTGKKAFDLSDLCHGLGIQMLLYLFALEKEGKALFGKDIIPAGVLYLPARDVLVSAPRNEDPGRLREALDKELRRSGMVLSQPEVLQAMEHSALESPRFLPLTLGKDGSITKGVATAAELGKLSRYVDKLLERIARELKSGNIDADPWSRGEQDNACAYCEFASACHFMDGDGGDHVQMIRPVRPEEFWRHVDQTIGEEESL